MTKYTGIKRYIVLSSFALALLPSMYAYGQSRSNTVRLTPAEALKPFEPPKIQSTGIPECDSYFTQIEACMKSQIAPEDYPELEMGLNEARQEILYMRDPQAARKLCNEALEGAKKEFASLGCRFN